VKTADTIRNKRRKYLKEKINELAMNHKNNSRDLYRGINEFHMGCKPRNTLMKAVNGVLFADSHNILNGTGTALLSY
jgi:hypothetical protein